MNSAQCLTVNLKLVIFIVFIVYMYDTTEPFTGANYLAQVYIGIDYWLALFSFYSNY